MDIPLPRNYFIHHKSININRRSEANIIWIQYPQHDLKLNQHGSLSHANQTKFDENQGTRPKHAYHNED